MVLPLIFSAYLYCMDYLIEIKDVPESKPLLDYLRTLKYVKVKEEGKVKSKYHFTDEEMALPGGPTPNQQQLEEWLTRPDKDKGTKAKTARNQLITKLRKEFSTKK